MSTFRERLKAAGRAVVGIFAPDSAKQAYGLLTGVYGYGGATPARTAEALLAAYSTMPWLRAVAGKISGAVAQVPWQVGYRQQLVEDGEEKRWVAVPDHRLRAGDAQARALRRKGLGDEFVALESHPLLTLLDTGNPFLAGMQVRQVTQIHLDILGEAFWLLDVDGRGAPTAIWPLPPTWIKETPDLKRRSYRVGYKGWQGNVPEQLIVWFRHPDPANPYGRGTGIVQALGDEFEIDEYAAKTMKTWFYNRARPDLIISPKLRETDDPPAAAEIRRLQERWLQDHEGFARASRPYFSNLPLTVDVVSQTFGEMQLKDLREHERNTILEVFGGLPPEWFGILENSNRSTIDAADYMGQRHVIQPRLELLRSVLQAQVAPRYDARLVVEYESPVTEDRAYQLEVMKAQPAVITVDEWRERSGLPPLEDGHGAAHVVPIGVEVRPTLDFAGEALIGDGSEVPSPNAVGVRVE